MQESKIISYNRDDFFLIKTSQLKKGEYIGRIKSIEPTQVLMSVYIFPEDTRDGRKEYMSSYEVFYTKNEIIYQFKGGEKKVFVLELEDYIKRKYIILDKENEDKFYFRRQSYDEKSNSFYPYLQKTCYCQKYFNPDLPFKTCGCGNYFHPNCLIKSNLSKCWNPNCKIDCTFFLTEKEKEQKKKNIKAQNVSNQNIPPPQKSVEIPENFFNQVKKEKSEIITLDEFASIKTPDGSKKAKKGDKDRNAKIDFILAKGNNSAEKRIKRDPHVINLGIKDEKNPFTITYDTTVYTRKSNQGTIKLESFSMEDIKRKTETEREKARHLFFTKLIDGINMLLKDQKFLDDFSKEKPDFIPKIALLKTSDKKQIEAQYLELATSIEKNLFEYCDKKTSQTYLNFLREFSASMKNAISILYRLILGDISAEEFSKFKPDDFLPEEKRKQKEELIRKAVQDMQFKEPMIIRATQVKGRMLTEIQDNIDTNKTNFIMDMMMNMNSEGGMSSEYHQKIKKMKEQYPKMSDNDIKFLVDAKEPSQDEIQNKLNSIIQETMNLEEQKELFSYRQNKLMKKAERYFKKKKDVKINEEKNNGVAMFLGKKIGDSHEYIKFISLDIKPY